MPMKWRAASRVVVVPRRSGAAEALAVARRELRPGGLETLVPGHQRAVVVGAEVVPVLEDEPRFEAFRDLPRGGQLAAREDVPLDPRVGARRCAIQPDGVQQEQPLGFEQAMRRLEEDGVVLRPHVLEHAHRGDLVKGLVQVQLAIVHQLHAHPSS